MSSIKNCPARFYLNCSQAQIACKDCAAYKGKGKLLYTPIDSSDKQGDLLNHPWHVNISKLKTLRRSRLTEKRQRQQVIKSVALPTIGSGNKLGDGDTKLLNGKLLLESKDRGNKSSWCLSLAEYNKGLRQNVSVFGITIHPPNSAPLTLYIIDDKLLSFILNLIQTDQP